MTFFQKQDNITDATIPASGSTDFEFAAVALPSGGGAAALGKMVQVWIDTDVELEMRVAYAIQGPSSPVFTDRGTIDIITPNVSHQFLIEAIGSNIRVRFTNATAGAATVNIWVQLLPGDSDEYPEQNPWLGWFLEQEILASTTNTGPIMDLHRGVGPNAASVPAEDNAVLLSGVSVGERLLVECIETGGLAAATLNILGGNDEGNLVALTSIGTVPLATHARFELLVAYPFVQLAVQNADVTNSIIVKYAAKIIPA